MSTESIFHRGAGDTLADERFTTNTRHTGTDFNRTGRESTGLPCNSVDMDAISLEVTQRLR